VSPALAAWSHQSGVNLPVVTLAASNPQYLAVTTDGAGGTIVTWHDQRGAGGANDIYAQHLLAMGGVDPAWPVNGRALCTATNYQTYPVIVSDGAGGAIVAWNDYRTASVGDIYAQHVLASGAGGAIVSWQDNRSGNYDIYAHHLRSGGTVDPNWAGNGLAVCTAVNDQQLQALVADGSGGAVITWVDLRNGSGNDIYAQHV